MISWLITRTRIDVESIARPPGGRAPGWTAGIVIAQSSLKAGDKPEVELERFATEVVAPLRRLP